MRSINQILCPGTDARARVAIIPNRLAPMCGGFVHPYLRWFAHCARKFGFNDIVNNHLDCLHIIITYAYAPGGVSNLSFACYATTNGAPVRQYRMLILKLLAQPELCARRIMFPNIIISISMRCFLVHSTVLSPPPLLARPRMRIMEMKLFKL